MLIFPKVKCEDPGHDEMLILGLKIVISSWSGLHHGCDDDTNQQKQIPRPCRCLGNGSSQKPAEGPN